MNKLYTIGVIKISKGSALLVGFQLNLYGTSLKKKKNSKKKRSVSTDQKDPVNPIIEFLGEKRIPQECAQIHAVNSLLVCKFSEAETMLLFCAGLKTEKVTFPLVRQKKSNSLAVKPWRFNLALSNG